MNTAENNRAAMILPIQTLQNKANKATKSRGEYNGDTKESSSCKEGGPKESSACEEGSMLHS